MYYTQKLAPALKKWYYSCTKKVLNLENPQTYNEKLQWLKLYNALPMKTKLADKYLVRDWIKENIGEEYLVPLLGVYNTFDEIDFNKLPNQFVIKCNHGSGYNIIVTNKAELNLKEAKLKVDKWMNSNFAYSCGFELHYRDIKPKIIIEEYIDPSKSNNEIQVWCFNNEIKFVSIETNKYAENLMRGTFYLDGSPTEFEISPNHYKKVKKLYNKKAFYKAIELVKKLNIDTPYVRIDFIEWNDTVKFREITFTSGTGLSLIKPIQYNKILGEWIKLPELAYDINTKTYYNPNKLNKKVLSTPYRSPVKRSKDFIHF